MLWACNRMECHCRISASILICIWGQGGTRDFRWNPPVTLVLIFGWPFKDESTRRGLHDVVTCAFRSLTCLQLQAGVHNHPKDNLVSVTSELSANEWEFRSGNNICSSVTGPPFWYGLLLGRGLVSQWATTFLSQEVVWDFSQLFTTEVTLPNVMIFTMLEILMEAESPKSCTLSASMGAAQDYKKHESPHEVSFQH